MASDLDRFFIRILRRGEHLGLLASAVALIMVEAVYVAWLERLPALPNSALQPGFLDLPPWYQRPRVEVTFLLTILGGVIFSAACGVAQLMRSRTGESGTSEWRGVAQKRLKIAAFYAVITGADLLFIQFFRL
jgi:hypothetical protein